MIHDGSSTSSLEEGGGGAERSSLPLRMIHQGSHVAILFTSHCPEHSGLQLVLKMVEI